MIPLYTKLPSSIKDNKVDIDIMDHTGSVSKKKISAAKVLSVLKKRYDDLNIIEQKLIDNE